MQTYEFRVKEISCGSAKEKIEISRSGAWLVLEGVVNIPDPCHSIKFFSEMDRDNRVLRVSIKASKIKVFCIQCLAKARFVLRFNTFYLKQNLMASRFRLIVNYYVRGRSAVLYNGEIEI